MADRQQDKQAACKVKHLGRIEVSQCLCLPVCVYVSAIFALHSTARVGELCLCAINGGTSHVMPLWCVWQHCALKSILLLSGNQLAVIECFDAQLHNCNAVISRLSLRLDCTQTKDTTVGH